MTWGPIPDLIAIIFAFIMLAYGRDTRIAPSLRTALFNLCLSAVVLRPFLFLLAYYTRMQFHSMPDPLVQVTNLISYAFVPLLSLLFLFYILSLVQSEGKKLIRTYQLLAIPYLLLLTGVACNPLNEFFLMFDVPSGYEFGPGYYLMYLISGYHTVAMIVAVVLGRRRLEPDLFRVLLLIPGISIFTIIILSIFPYLHLAGVASTAIMLIMLLFIQNKKSVLDNLTGLQNREALLDLLSRETSRSSITAVILMDLDDFHFINDNFGMKAGNQLLKEIGLYLRKIVTPYCLYRYQGDQFAIVLDRRTKLDPVELIDEIRKRFHKPWHFSNLSLEISVSIAAAQAPFPDRTRNIMELLEYSISDAKVDSKGKTVSVSLETLEKLQRRRQIYEIMKRELETGGSGFELYYQPIYSIQDRCFPLAEALLRLHTAELGTISPAEFVPIAEQKGLIIPLGHLVFERVCQFILRTEEAGIQFEAVSFNVSILQMAEMGLVERIRRTMDHYRVDPRKVRIEITESSFMRNADHLRQLMSELGRLGIQFYLDDFGTFYSNFAPMLQLNFQIVKIDKSILDAAIKRDNGKVILSGLIRMFVDFGIKVVVEGVETPKQSAMLEEFQAHYLQGFLCSRPVPEEELIRYFSMKEVGIAC